MALKRALVVDDSKVARIALKKQLEQHDLAVELADSGEDALDLLKTRMVDVVFMDHEMPGMNGLEAVKAIKSNPRTATIPVMMYTSRGGELYVSQARALGAVDLLPKEVEPGVLFGMLLRLGLVNDRRKGARDATAADTAADTVADTAAGTDEAPVEEAAEEPVGMAMSSLLTRILEDQHSELRSQMMRRDRSFAKQVAAEILEQQKDDEAATKQPAPAAATAAGWPMLTGALAVGLLWLATWIVQVSGERDVLSDDLTRLGATVERERLSSMAAEQRLTSSFNAERNRAEFELQQLLESLAWAVNETGSVPFGEPPWNLARGEQLGELLMQLSNAAFQGTVRVESHLGEFCLESDSAGAYRLADPDAPLASCTFVGHPLDDSTLLEDRRTPEFANFLAESQIVNGVGIGLELVALTRLESMPRAPYPINALTAGEWNAVAELNNRLEFSFLSDSPAQ